MVDIQSPTAEIRRGKKRKKEERNRMKIYMVSLFHRATIKQTQQLTCRKPERKRERYTWDTLVMQAMYACREDS